MIYTVSVIFVIASGPVIGFLVDYIKSRLCLVISAVALAIGCTLGGFSDSKTFVTPHFLSSFFSEKKRLTQFFEKDVWIPAFAFIGFGSPGQKRAKKRRKEGIKL